MLFKTFDVNVNWVQIDHDVIPRPAYIGAGQWMTFWEEAAAIGDDTGWKDGYDEGYKDGLNAAEDEHKADIARIEDECDNRIANLEEEIAALEDELSELKYEMLNPS